MAWHGTLLDVYTRNDTCVDQVPRRLLDYHGPSIAKSGIALLTVPGMPLLITHGRLML